MSDETRLSEELARRAEAVSGAPIDLDAVRGRARRIRRRRATGAVAAVVAVAAVAVPAALLGGDGDRSPQPAPSPTRGVDPGRGLVTLQDGVIIAESGPRVPLQLDRGETADGFALLGPDRYVVTAQTRQGERRAVVVDAVGTVVARYPINGGLATAAENAAVAWVTPDGSTLLARDGADRADRLAAVDGADPTAAAITGECSSECRVVVRIQGGRGLGPSWSVSTSGEVAELSGEVPAVSDATADGTLLAGVSGPAADDIHACGGVYDVGADDFLWRGCQDNVFDFSPDGALVATTFAEGLGPTAITIRDARDDTALGAVRGSWISSWHWQDPTHLLVVRIGDDGTTDVVRLGRDGETATVLEGFRTDLDTLRPAVILPSP